MQNTSEEVNTVSVHTARNPVDIYRKEERFEQGE